MRTAALGATLLLVALGAACPDYPDDAFHQDTSNADCVSCHVEGGASRPPESHFEEGELKPTREDCVGCHKMAQ